MVGVAAGDGQILDDAAAPDAVDGDDVATQVAVDRRHLGRAGPAQDQVLEADANALVVGPRTQEHRVDGRWRRQIDRGLDAGVLFGHAKGEPRTHRGPGEQQQNGHDEPS